MPALEDRLLDGEPGEEDWEVYADWLEQQGDARGELVRLSLARARTDDAETLAQIDVRIAKLGAELDGPLLELAGGFELDWRCGHVDSLCAVEPWVDEQPTARARLAALLDAPACRLLRSLAIDREDRTDVPLGKLGARGIFEWAAPVLIERSLPQLRRLRVGAGPSERMHVSDTSNWMLTSDSPGSESGRICRPDRYVGDLAPALARMPKLCELHVTGEGIRLAELPATLRSLRLEARFLRRSTVHAIAAATLPELRHLELWLGHWPDSVEEFSGPEGEEFYGPSVDHHDLAGLFAGEGLPALRHLGLSNCAYTSKLLEPLARSQILPRLDTLDLSYGFLLADDLGPLLADPSRFAHLRRLDLSHHRLDDAAVEQLRVLFGDRIELGQQFERRGSAALRLLSF